jgi:hypothetical protein
VKERGGKKNFIYWIIFFSKKFLSHFFRNTIQHNKQFSVGEKVRKVGREREEKNNKNFNRE